MSRIVLVSACFLMIPLGGCGGGPSGAPSLPASPTAPTTQAPPSTPVIASGDNWSFRFEGFTGVGITGALGRGATLTSLEGSFNPSGDAITAVLNPFGRCFNADQDRARFTGTRSSSAVQLQSQPVNGQVIQLTGTLSAAGDVFEGAYSITGGCGNGASGRMTGRPVNLTGVWTGTMGVIPTVFNLQMASTPDADANYVLSGSATFSNTQCFPNAVITRRARGRVLFPDVVSDAQRLELIAEVSEDRRSPSLHSFRELHRRLAVAVGDERTYDVASDGAPGASRGRHGCQDKPCSISPGAATRWSMLSARVPPSVARPTPRHRRCELDLRARRPRRMPPARAAA